MKSKKKGASTSADEKMQQRIMDEANALLLNKGHDGFSLRELSKLANTSTMTMYTLFGGRTGLLEALFDEGFARLIAYEQRTIDRENPSKWLHDKLCAYRDFAMENTGYYKLMFGGVLKFKPIDTDERFRGLSVPSAIAYPAFSSLVEAISACQEVGALRNDIEAPQLAFMFWAFIHGLISLEFAGYSSQTHDNMARYENSIAIFTHGLKS